MDRNIKNGKRIIYKMYGANHKYGWTASHNIDPYRKSLMVEAISHPRIHPELARQFSDRFRTPFQIPRIILHEYLIANRTADVRKYGFWDKIWLTVAGRISEVPKYAFSAKRLERLRKMPNLFVINDGGKNPSVDEYNRKFLEKTFPDKSEFEK
jgi:hypothetical protein